MSSTSELIVIGKIGAPFGVKGWVKIQSYTDISEDIFSYLPWILGDSKEIKVDQWKEHGKGLVAKLVECDDRNAVELIKNLTISIPVSLLPALENDYYWRDLIGMRVITDKGYDLGTVKDMFETGANDVMVVKANTKDAFGQKERMLPFLHDQVVLKVDMNQRVITVDWDPGF